MPDSQGFINTGFENPSAPSNAVSGALTCTLNSLANNGQRSSAALTCYNAYHPALSPSGHNMGATDYSLVVKVKTGAAVGGSQLVNVYICGSNDGGVTWGDGVSGLGSDSAVTLTSPRNLLKIGSINTPATAHTYVGGPWSVGAAFGGVPPSAWCVVIENLSGGSLDSIAGGTISYQFSVAVFF